MKASRASALGLALGCLVMGWSSATAQDLPRRLERLRKMALPADEVWRRAVQLVADSPGIVNTLDSESKLVSFTLPLSADDVKNMALEAKEIDRQSQMAHITIWVAQVGAETAAFVRASPGNVGFFSHSNGLIESQILDALQQGKAWRSAGAGEKVKELAQPLARVWDAANAMLKGSARVTLNEANRRAAMMTCSMFIASSAFKLYTPVAQGYYPGAVNVTLWFDETGQTTRLRTRALMLESGSVSPTALASTGQLENTLFEAIEKRLSGDEVSLTIASDYKGKPDFWMALFGGRSPNLEEAEKAGLKQELPAPVEQVWFAALKVLTQSSVIIKCNWPDRVLNFVAAHPSNSPAKYSAHDMSVRLAPAQFGTMLYVMGESANDTPKELDSERRMIAERIATELFLKDKLKWLLKSKGGDK